MLRNSEELLMRGFVFGSSTNKLSYHFRTTLLVLHACDQTLLTSLCDCTVRKIQCLCVCVSVCVRSAERDRDSEMSGAVSVTERADVSSIHLVVEGAVVTGATRPGLR